jgi:hypothetical protein
LAYLTENTGVERLYPGPFCSFYDWNPCAPSPPLATLLEAHEYVEEVLQPECEGGLGPFDGIIGFSQGAALAASYLLYNNGLWGIRFAVFICGTRPWDISGKRRLECSDVIKGHEWLANCSDAPSLEHEREPVSPDWEAAGLRRIGLPTAHIHGKHDEWLEDSRHVFAMCEPRSATVWEHASGHTIPVDRKNTAIIADVVRAVIRRANSNH